MRSTTEPVRAGADWLALREPADAAARSTELVERLLGVLPRTGPLEIHDLGCGTGSMTRWLAGRLPGPQRWVLHDRDEELLERALATPPRVSADGYRIAVDARADDITLLQAAELSSADLVVGSALLDMLTAAELDRLVSSCSASGAPALLALSVVGRVDLTPPDALDATIMEAFNAHQRRMTSAGRLLGPDAPRAAADAFARRGLDVTVRSSPWRLGPESSTLLAQWFAGWLGAACEQRPELTESTQEFADLRRAQLADGTLAVVVHHVDLLVQPRQGVGSLLAGSPRPAGERGVELSGPRRQGLEPRPLVDCAAGKRISCS